MSGLIAFEATARHLSFSRAAEDLALTQGAVSKRVRQLEGVLGFQLLTRNTNQVSLTEIGQTYLGHARKLLRQLQTSTEDIRASAQGRDSIRVAAQTAFAIRWLVPRLAGFSGAFPNCTVNLLSFCSSDDPQLVEADCMICDGPLPWRDGQTSTLVSGPSIVVASPAMAGGGVRAVDPRQLAGMARLACNRTPDLWQQWFAAEDCNDSTASEARFDDLAVLIEAAVAGQGIALLPEFLVADDIRQGRLKVLCAESRTEHSRYRVGAPLRHKGWAPIQGFVEWITRPEQACAANVRRLPSRDADPVPAMPAWTPAQPAKRQAAGSAARAPFPLG
ncbi:LysR substrate-binding domain-containing protein [Mesorhizobium sp. ZMM04-5]|uniref:LysR substrate-binding domain-containing protein n=1 Tax=Mesorhizobium marinum TaxID=3228790 RepID=A0ABV3QZX2_9HYPH